MKILLVGGNKLQAMLIQSHYKMEFFRFKHIVQKTKVSPSVPDEIDLIIFWSKHLTSSLQTAVMAKLPKNMKICYCYSNTDLLTVMIDATWGIDKYQKMVDQPMALCGTIPDTLDESTFECPSAIAKTKYRLKEFERLTCGNREELKIEDTRPSDTEINDNMLIESGEPSDDSLVSEDSHKIRRTSSTKIYCAKTTIVVVAIDQFDNEIITRTSSIKHDGPVYDYVAGIQTIAANLGNMVGHEAQRMIHDRNCSNV